MIQIDGLSQPQFERAIDRGERLFLRPLIRREHCQIHARELAGTHMVPIVLTAQAPGTPAPRPKKPTVLRCFPWTLHWRSANMRACAPMTCNVHSCVEMAFHFHPALHREEERYGDAILTHLPRRLVKAGPLHGLASRPLLEPRERKAQVAALLGNDWLAHERCREPVILYCDFNALPSSSVWRGLAGRLKEVHIEAQHHCPKGTLSRRFPGRRTEN